MATSPTRHAPHLPPPQPPSMSHLSSPRSTRTLRKLQSAQALSTAYVTSNAPSLISQQRQQQQQQRSAPLRDNYQTSTLPPPPAQSPTRTRANSDAPVATTSNSAPAPKRNAAARKIITTEAFSKDELDSIVRQGPRGDLLGSLDNLRRTVLIDGVDADSDGMSHLRIYIWLILLNAPPLATDNYLSLIHRGASPAYNKIRNDTFRTLATDPLFKRRVSEASLIRLLNAIAWKLHDAKSPPPPSRTLSPLSSSTTYANSPDDLPSAVTKHTSTASTTTISSTSSSTHHHPSPTPSIYVQGMNVLCAPFLYTARSEAEAFIAFHRFITAEVPAYVRPTMDGVHRGVSLVDKVLALVDPKLSAYLLSKSLPANLYAFPSVLTLCACTPPLPEVLTLWDFLFAYGAHLNVLCIVAQLCMVREEVLASKSPGKVLRAFPPLQARRVVEMACLFVGRIPPGVYRELVEHAK